MSISLHKEKHLVSHRFSPNILINVNNGKIHPGRMTTLRKLYCRLNFTFTVPIISSEEDSLFFESSILISKCLVNLEQLFSELGTII